MDVWYFPSWNGDFRLLRDDKDDRSLLEIVEPTIAEQELLIDFLARANEQKWTAWPRSKKLRLKSGRQTVKLKASVAEAGKVLLALLKPGPQTLTAVKLEDGQIEIVENAKSGAFRTAAAGALAETEPKKVEPKKAKKAASVKRPTPCCPSCIPGAVDRASEVLLSFLTPEQHEQWAATRSIEVRGHLSGHRYVIAHRHSELAQQWGRICADLDDGQILHFHDWSVPPEEEVLASKLVLEHREPWLRNEATCLSSFANGDLVSRVGFTDVYKNPFGDVMDGTEDADMMRQVGGFLLGLVGRAGP